MKGADLSALLKRVMEVLTPNLRSYYRMPVKGRVVKTYASDGNYWADVKPTRNDESDDDGMPVIPKVEIPVMWGGPERGVVCPIPERTRVVVSFFDGDPNYPFISHVRWHGNKAPVCEVNAFIIQSAPDCYVKIDAEKNILTVTPKDVRTNVGGDMSVEVVGNIDLQVGGDITASVDGDMTATVGGDVTATVGGDATASVDGDMTATVGGDVTASVGGHVTAAAGGDIMASADGSAVVETGGDATISAGGNVSISGTAIELN